MKEGDSHLEGGALVIPVVEEDNIPQENTMAVGKTPAEGETCVIGEVEVDPYTMKADHTIIIWKKEQIMKEVSVIRIANLIIKADQMTAGILPYITMKRELGLLHQDISIVS